MPLAAGARLGPYEIVAPIGAGGMGAVYKARDTRLGREVAVKVSAEQFSERFQREARAIAALNHPNICHLYDVGPNYLVMELIEGPTLAEKLKEGPLPFDEAITIARQIADGVEAAHEKGVIHRDLKPGNVKIKPDGTVKVLDFGLAKLGGTPTFTASDESPTLTMHDTQAGVILGTASYMSPEQARGKEVDKRADIFSFGAVLYEMLTGKRLFQGETVSELLASVIKEQPDLSAAPASTRRLLRRCLEKDPKNRLRDIGDAGVELKEILQGHGEEAAPVASAVPVKRSMPRWIWGAAAIVVVAATALWAFSRGMLGEHHTLYVQLAPPEGTEFATFGSGAGGYALSPDGKMVTFIAKTNGKNGLWVRPVDEPTAKLLPGTEGAGTPFWSPDSRMIGFPLNGRLARIEVAGTAPVTVCEGCAAAQGTWTADGRIIQGGSTGLTQVPASGGMAKPLTTPDEKAGELGHLFPQVVAGDRLIYWVRNKNAEESGEYIVSLSNPADRAKLISTTSSAAYAQDGDGNHYLFYVRGETLLAQKLDLDARKLVGEPRAIADSVSTTGTTYRSQVSASTKGSFVYTSPIRYQFTWFDRAGRALGKVGEPGEYINFRLSPDGRRIVSSRDLPKETDMWLLDVERGSASRLTFVGTYQDPMWSPDSKTLIFNSVVVHDLFRKSADGSANEQRLGLPASVGKPWDWSRDGRYALYGGGDLWVAPVNPDGSLAGKPTVYSSMMPFRLAWARFQPIPEPKWVAYQSNESGRLEVYVQAFPHPKGKFQISTGGGRLPEWSPDGTEIFYVSPDFKLTAVKIKISGDKVEPSAPQELFRIQSTDLNATISPYAVADAQKFLVRAMPLQLINLVVDWPALLKKKASPQ